MKKYRHKTFYRRRHYSKSEPFLFFLSVSVLLGVLLMRVPVENYIHLLFLSVAIFGLVLFLLIAFFLFLKQKKLQAVRMSGVDKMTGNEFEHYVKFLLEKQGYTKVYVTKTEGDFGVDVIGYKDGEKYAVQVKRYRGLVGVDAIYQVVGGAKYYDCDKTTVVTNSYFTTQARELSHKTNTELIDREKLGSWIENF